ncbi:MAG: 50S ribosomal protein L29 [Nitrososphaerota archaeon]|nr:50S ribosomal protein L29 [Nitrososphaerota archaeon]MDG6926883.1 50S ribosomal protein L29 [Nitrososphaerota archaeon]MDG6929999.1 50S ribosomal protein L29 [Nitrososphaerota archaeon]MDG6931950.1 50S ribosomal protein L29 [Nitrososphaerota archaeon]MDG6943847.1 50S ribosomal protein L29 [Nitrososphaerota archaeon]
MKAIKVTKLSDEDLKKNLDELRKESLRLRNLRVTRMLAKESGSIKSVRRNMARVLTEMKKRGIKS